MTNETTQDPTAHDGGALVDMRAGRRAFLQSLGLATAGLAALGTGVVTAGGIAQAAPLTDADILNFALNLEYLEAEFYLQAAFGRGLADGDTTGKGNRGGVSGGAKVPFKSKDVQDYAREIAKDEEDHVKFLRAGLGSAAVARPKIDLKKSFTAAAQAAGVIGKDDTFDPFADEDSFLIGAFIFEDVGVTAYKGAARFLENKDFLEAAAGILAVEAYHAGMVRTLLYGRGLFQPANAISELRASVGGGKDQGIRRNGRANIVPADSSGIAFSRTPEEVLAIVYLGGKRDGGFFPKGLNGSIAKA
jgi:hypothetical protein